MEKREELLTWALAFAVFLLVAWLVASYSYREARVFNLLSFWRLFGLSVEPYFLYFLFLFPVLYFLANRFTSSRTLKNVLLVNSFLLPAYFFFQFVKASENISYPAAYPPYSQLLGLDITWFQGMQPSWFPFFLLTTVLVLLLALVAVFSEKLKLLKNAYLKWGLVLSIAIIFFLECSLVSFGVYDSNSRLFSSLVSENCAKKVSANWTPRYLDELKPKLLQRAEETIQLVNLGKIRTFGAEKVFGPEYLRYKYVHNELHAEFNKQYYACARDIFSKTGFPKPEFVRGLIFIPASIVCLLFSLKVFRRKPFASPVLEKGFLVAAIPLWSAGIANLSTPTLFAFIVSVAVIVPVAYWLGLWPGFPERKK